MEIKNDFRECGEKENHRLLVRLTKSQKQRLRALTEASGFKSVSDFVRITLLNPTVDMKLNKILEILQENEKQEKTKEENAT